VADAAGGDDWRPCHGGTGDPYRRHADRGAGPGLGKTRTGRLWTYLTDERPGGGERAPTAWYRFSPDRKGERPREHLASFHGVIQADAYSGYEALVRRAAPLGTNAPRIMHAACWAHARRKLFDEFERTKSPIAEEALRRIGELYEIEAQITGHGAETRHKIRQKHAMPILDGLRSWFHEQRRRLSAKTNLAKALQYALTRWEGLCLYTTDGRIGIDNNPAERALRGIAITRKNLGGSACQIGGMTDDQIAILRIEILDIEPMIWPRWIS
jgi:transposase